MKTALKAYFALLMFIQYAPNALSDVPTALVTARATGDFRTLNCADVIKPDRLIISGGISTESIRPKQASDKLEQQLVVIRTYVKSKNGILHEKELLRAARNPERERDGVSKLPFMQMLRFEAEFPTTVDVDEILERLLKLGMDRYGKEASLDGYVNQSYKVLTGYRFSDVHELAQSVRARCVKKIMQDICGATAAESCVQSAVIHSVSIQTEPLAVRDGYKRAFTAVLSDNADSQSFDLELLETLSANPIRVLATVSLTMPALKPSKK